MDQFEEWKLTVLNNRYAILRKWKWTFKITWLWTILNDKKSTASKVVYTICFQYFNCPLESIGPPTFVLRSVHGRESRESDSPYSLLDTIQFKSSLCTLEWTVYSHINCWLSSGRQSTLPQESWARKFT